MALPREASAAAMQVILIVRWGSLKIKEQLFAANGLFGKDLKNCILKATCMLF